MNLVSKLGELSVQLRKSTINQFRSGLLLAGLNETSPIIAIPSANVQTPVLVKTRTLAQAILPSAQDRLGPLPMASLGLGPHNRVLELKQNVPVKLTLFSVILIRNETILSSRNKMLTQHKILLLPNRSHPNSPAHSLRVNL